MHVLMAHNYYKQRGGEGYSFEAEVELLESRGHSVTCYTLNNDEIDNFNAWEKVSATLWNRGVYDELRDLIRRERPDIVHFNNTFPLLAPTAYHAAQADGVPIVKTLRNYRPACLNGVLFRDGQVCEDCVGRTVPWPGIKYSCYRGSRLESLGAASWMMMHRVRNTWKEVVDTFVVCSRFAGDKLAEAGIPSARIQYKPNFLHPAPRPGSGDGQFALFVGRLSAEKGVETLVRSWKQIGQKLPLKIVGDGPLSDVARRAEKEVPGIKWLGRKQPAEVYDLMGQATVVVFPSEWYETFGRVGMEAFAKGTPVIVSDLGGQAELVDHNRTGRLFTPGDASDLVRQVQWVLDHPSEWKRMRTEARAEFEEHYTADRNYEILMDIYQRTLNRKPMRRGQSDTSEASISN